MKRWLFWFTMAFACLGAAPFAALIVYAQSWLAFQWLVSQMLSNHVDTQTLAYLCGLATGAAFFFASIWCLIEKRWPWQPVHYD